MLSPTTTTMAPDPERMAAVTAAMKADIDLLLTKLSLVPVDPSDLSASPPSRPPYEASMECSVSPQQSVRKLGVILMGSPKTSSTLWNRQQQSNLSTDQSHEEQDHMLLLESVPPPLTMNQSDSFQTSSSAPTTTTTPSSKLHLADGCDTQC